MENADRKVALSAIPACDKLPTKPARSRRFELDLLAKTYDEFATAVPGECLDARFCRCVGSLVAGARRRLPGAWLHLAQFRTVDSVEVIPAAQSLPPHVEEQVRMLFATVQDCQLFLSLRCKFSVTALLASLIPAMGMNISEAKVAEVLEQCKSQLSVLDAMGVTDPTHDRLWHKVAESLALALRNDGTGADVLPPSQPGVGPQDAVESVDQSDQGSQGTQECCHCQPVTAVQCLYSVACHMKFSSQLALKEEKPRHIAFDCVHDMLGAMSDGLHEEQGLAPSPSVLRCFIKSAEAFIHTRCLVGMSKLSDLGYTNIGVITDLEGQEVSKKPRLCFTGAHPHDGGSRIALHFFGNISVMPSNGALPLCKAFGIQFFISPSASMLSPSSELLTPAWFQGVCVTVCETF
eukprot:1442627-Amphidinium_carterae.1